MGHILKRLALVLVPVYVWLAFFIAFEPNNYFGLKADTDSSQRWRAVRAYQQDPGRSLIVGDSRLAHFDMALVEGVSGRPWQNLAFGGASLRESIDLANFVLSSGHEVDEILFELSFYTVNDGYDTDRFSALEETLVNPLAYCLNLEYNVNALTMFMNWVRQHAGHHRVGDWGPADYLDDAGNTLPLHRRLYEYPALIDSRCRDWGVNGRTARAAGTAGLSLQGQRRGADHRAAADGGNVRSEVCEKYGIDDAMQNTVLPLLQSWQADTGLQILDYEWGGSCITDDDTQFFDGFHLDELYGLPDWTRELFADVNALRAGA